MKKAIVVGASSGLGKVLARLLIENGYKVGITGRRMELLETIKAENTENYCVRCFDTRATATLHNPLEELVHELGGLDLLVISAGTGDENPKLDFEIEKSTIETNISGFTCIADWAFNFFENQKHGHLVGISSIAGIRGSRLAPSYSASKAYQINYLEGLSQKAKNSRLPIHVSDIRPGFVDTAMAKGEGQFWVADVEKAASQMLSAILSKQKVVYVTKRWKLIAILLKLAPNSLIQRM